jgi:CBS domain-containing protein
MVAHSSEMIGANWDRLRVRHLMSAPAVTVHADATVADAARAMLVRHIHRLVVVDDDGAPVGVVTPLDLLRSLLADPDPALT